MTQFEERVLRDLSELKAHMQWLVGNGNQGKMQELEGRLQKHEAASHRMGGVGAALAVAVTLVHFAFDYMRTLYR